MDVYSFIFLLLPISAVLLLLIGLHMHVQENLEKIGPSALPYRPTLSKKKRYNILYLIPIVNVIKLYLDYPELSSDTKETFENTKKLAIETGILFPRPKEVLSYREQSLFYLEKICSMNQLLKQPFESSGKDYFHSGKSSKEQNTISFFTSEETAQFLYYCIPSPSLTFLASTKNGCGFSISYSDHKRLFEKTSHIDFYAFTKGVREEISWFKKAPNPEKYDEVLIQHLETFKKIYSTFEESLVKNGEISDSLFEKSTLLLQNFMKKIKEINESHQTSTSIINKEIEEKLEKGLEQEIIFQQTHILRDSKIAQ